MRVLLVMRGGVVGLVVVMAVCLGGMRRVLRVGGVMGWRWRWVLLLMRCVGRRSLLLGLRRERRRGDEKRMASVCLRSGYDRLGLGLVRLLGSSRL